MVRIQTILPVMSHDLTAVPPISGANDAFADPSG